MPVWKPGKLPRETVSVPYEPEYGVDALELHSDAVADGARVLVHDDLIATGVTVAATVEAVERLGGSVAGCSFVVELASLAGRERLGETEVRSLISCED